MESGREPDGKRTLGAQDFRADGVLHDGTPVCVRAIRADDKVRLHAGFHRLTTASIHRRFLSLKSTLSAHELRYLTELDFVNHVALAVTVGESAHEALIAVGRFIRDRAKAGEAEIALIVADEYRHRGAATLLLAHLASLARRLGIHKFVGAVQVDNHEIFELLQKSGLAVEARLEAAGTKHVEVALDRN